MSEKKNYLPLILAVTSLLFLAAALLTKISDPDFWMHLAAGRYDLQNGIILDKEVFTFSRYGIYWCNHEWLYQHFLYLLYLLADFKGVLLANTLLTCATFFIVYKSLEVKNKKQAVYAWLLIILAFNGFIERLTVRPHILSLFFMVVYVYILQKHAAGKLKHPFYILLPQLLWINVHGGTAFLGYFYLGAYILQATARYFTNRKQNREPDLKILRQLLVCLIGALLVSLINPYTYHILTFPFQHMQNEYQAQRITEWQPISLTTMGFSLGIMSFLVFLALPVFYRTKQWGILLLTLLFAALTLRHMRFRTEFLTLAIWPIYAFCKELRPAALWTKNVLKSVLIILLVVALSDLLIGLRTYKVAGLGVDRRTYPQKAINFIKRYFKGKKIINNYPWGGYLMWELPENLIFIDGRNIPSEQITFREFDAMYSYSPNQGNTLIAILQKYQADLVLYMIKGNLQPNAADLFPASKWALIYFDQQCALYLPRQAKNESAITRFEYKVLNPQASALADYQPALTDEKLAAQMIKELNRALSDDPANLLALSTLAKYYSAKQEWPAAIAVLRKMLEIDAQSTWVWIKLGKALKQTDQLAASRSCFEKARSLGAGLGPDK